jgi:ADP-heptose:LPS heptosyltransferase
MRILVVRRDNIGDLVCTTPLLTALRQRFPQAWIGCLVNSYNAAVLERNTDLDAVLAYTKLKHLQPGESALAVLRARLAMLWRLRRARLDHVLLATADARTARLLRWLRPRHLLVAPDGDDGRHEVERVFALGAHFGIRGEIPPLRLVPDPAEVELARSRFPKGALKVAMHISARRPAQRWPAERFAGLAQRLPGPAMLLWSPGPASHPRHPGDDEKARAVADAAPGKVFPYATERLQQLIGALAAADVVVCSDGGTSHLAAALGKPLVCLFGDSSPGRWRPWGVPQRLLQPASRDVRDISVADALSALESLARSIKPT